LLVHPECKAEVIKHADFVGSTTAIIDFAKKSDRTEFIIGTENSIAEHLQYACPDKKFYILSKNLICADMRATTLHDLLAAVEGTGGEVMNLDEKVMSGARRCIDAMIKLG
jgi:quinolinate synthase